MKIDEHVAKK